MRDSQLAPGELLADINVPQMVSLLELVRFSTGSVVRHGWVSVGGSILLRWIEGWVQNAGIVGSIGEASRGGGTRTPGRTVTARWPALVLSSCGLGLERANPLESSFHKIAGKVNMVFKGLTSRYLER